MATKTTKTTKTPKTPKRLLSHSRPPYAQRSSRLSCRATRTLIQAHHALHKQLAQARASNDLALATSIQAQIKAAGGLSEYQRASIQGQSSERGGDSSRVLMEWLVPHLPSGSTCPLRPELRLLEVGALRVDNACARSGAFEMERIDLHSQHPDILEQDFMARPLPSGGGELEAKGFDVVSLSLVVNYVPDAAGRGQMLRRAGDFLRGGHGKGSDGSPCTGPMFPGLFLVLPLPCVLNSRYLTEERLCDLMRAIGFERTRKKVGNKLVYYYFTHHGQKSHPARSFTKLELKKGDKRNNFAIVLR